MNNKQILNCLLTAIVLPISMQLLAQTPTPSVPDRAIVEQKRALVERILADSQRLDVAPGGKASEVKEKFVSATQHVRRAQVQLEKGEIAAADRSLNDAMRQISSARSLVSQPDIRKNTEQLRFTELLQSIEVLEASYLRNVERRSAWLAEVGDEDLKRVKILVTRAKNMASTGQLPEANAELIKAQRDMIASYNRLLGTAPLIYDLRFATAEAEYKYELERGRDYEGLVPVAILQYKPARDTLVSINRMVDESRALTSQARLDAGGRRYQSAIAAQRQAIVKLQRALELAGIVVPQLIPN
ncbi:MAG: hypothetical protein ABL931_01580 [Usitatibacteraceae bacterium]